MKEKKKKTCLLGFFKYILEKQREDIQACVVLTTRKKYISKYLSVKVEGWNL